MWRTGEMAEWMKSELLHFSSVLPLEADEPIFMRLREETNSNAHYDLSVLKKQILWRDGRVDETVWDTVSSDCKEEGEIYNLKRKSGRVV